MAKLRQKYWIGKMCCTVCRRVQGVPAVQQMADLPRNRVSPDDPPFTSVGVDCFGPFDVKPGRSQVERYRVIFRCLALRAVHIEVSASLDTDSFINAILRFIARRGQVKDGAEWELRRSMESFSHP